MVKRKFWPVGTILTMLLLCGDVYKRQQVGKRSAVREELWRQPRRHHEEDLLKASNSIANEIKLQNLFLSGVRGHTVSRSV